MKCPACFNVLTELQVGRLKVDVCHGGCGGIWFDAFELQQVDEEDEQAGFLLLSIPRDDSVTVDPQLKRSCPRCEGIKLKRRFYSARREVEIDECPGCGGVWLDAGELQRIRREHEMSRLASIELEGSRLTMSAIRHLYRVRLEGESGAGEGG